VATFSPSSTSKINMPESVKPPDAPQWTQNIVTVFVVPPGIGSLSKSFTPFPKGVDTKAFGNALKLIGPSEKGDNEFNDLIIAATAADRSQSFLQRLGFHHQLTFCSIGKRRAC